MKAATINEIKQELKGQKPARILELALRLARFKKENKELLTYLLFESGDEQSFVNGIKAEMDLQFKEINTSTKYFTKKGVRKILRMVNKYIRYSSVDQTEVELRIYFALQLLNSGIAVTKSKELTNLFENQVKKINDSLKGLHEDLQYDYQEEIKKLVLPPVRKLFG